MYDFLNGYSDLNSIKRINRQTHTIFQVRCDSILELYHSV